MEIQGSAAIVTGGGSGLGEATARELVARGARVAILDLGRSKGAEVAKSLGDAAHLLRSRRRERGAGRRRAGRDDSQVRRASTWS